MAKFEMDTEFIRRLAKLLDETNLGEIEMADGDRRIRVARPTAVSQAAVPVAAVPLAVTAPGSAAPVANDLSKHPGAVKSPMRSSAKGSAGDWRGPARWPTIAVALTHE